MKQWDEQEELGRGGGWEGGPDLCGGRRAVGRAGGKGYGGLNQRRRGNEAALRTQGSELLVITSRWSGKKGH